MSKFSLDKVLDSLIQDLSFRQAFQRDPAKTLASMNLSRKEKDILEQLDVDALVAGGNSVKDELLRGAHI